MTDLPSNVIRFPRPYRRPPTQRRPAPIQAAKPVPKLKKTDPYYDEWINLIEVVKSGVLARTQR